MNLDLETDVYPHVANAAAARALLAHERNLRIMAAGSNGYYYLDVFSKKNKRLCGLTTVMSHELWCDAPPPRGSSSNNNNSKREYARTSVGAATGIALGTLVHVQAHDVMTMDPASFKRRHRQTGHAWTQQYLDALLARGWFPLASEFLVYNEHVRVGTAIDLVAVDTRGTLIFVELKTGYTGAAWTTACGPMRGAMAGVLLDAPCNRAYVQVMLGAALAIVSHQIQGATEAWVAHVDATGVVFERVSAAFCLAHAPRILCSWQGKL